MRSRKRTHNSKPNTSGGKKSKHIKKIKSSFRNLFFATSILLSSAAVISIVLLLYIAFSPVIENDTVLHIPTKATYKQVCDSLRMSGDVRDYRFDIMARICRYPKYIKPGMYRLSKGISSKEAIKKLRSGAQDEVKFRFSRLSRIESLAKIIENELEPDSCDAMNFFSSSKLSDFMVDSVPLNVDNLLAVCIPNTYFFKWNTKPSAFVERMLLEFDRFWTEERLNKLQEMGRSKIDVIILASIVEKETNVDAEKADVASVYLNRLKVRMPLQADPTVIYAHRDSVIKRVKKSHLQIDSPYNTYKNRGLPPGPICTPSIASIDAVLANKKTPYFYFCAKDDFSGRHAFAATLEEHINNGRRYHEALTERNIL